MPAAGNLNASSEGGVGGGYWTPGRGVKLAMEWKWPLLGCVALYLPAINLLQNVMKNRQPLKLRSYTIIWNMGLATLSFVGALLMLCDDWTVITHMRVEESSFQPRTRMVVAVFCLTKVLEFGDTLILALKKRPIIFLHTYHHLTVALYCWHAQYMRVNFAHIFVFMNLLVHGAMYLYYGLTSIFQRNRVLSSVRPYITLTQIGQMLLGVVVSGVAMYSNDMTSTRATWWNAQMCMIMYVSYCFLFTAFYIENFHKSLRPMMASFLGMFHIFAIIGIVKMCLHQQALRLFLEAMCLYIVGGFGITCGAHRLWAHRSYKASAPFRTFLLICNSVANQGSIFTWSRDHRVHHKYSDTPADPHNANRGFFYSHMGWLLMKKPREVAEAGKLIDCSDLLEDPLVRLQKRFDPYWDQFFSFVMPSTYAYFMYNDFWVGFFVLGAFRWLVCLHATWTVNSVAHMWGARPYNTKIWPRENWLTALVAVGEGWHNWHHVYPFDYATSEGGVLDQWNPSKLVIDFAAALGMAWDRKRATDVWELTKQRRTNQLRIRNGNSNSGEDEGGSGHSPDGFASEDDDEDNADAHSDTTTTSRSTDIDRKPSSREGGKKTAAAADSLPEGLITASSTEVNEAATKPWTRQVPCRSN